MAPGQQTVERSVCRQVETELAESTVCGEAAEMDIVS